jgi:hypothetical protein
MEAFEVRMRRGGATALEHIGRFFMKEDAVNETLRNVAHRLDELEIPYAVAGGMALGAHGHVRATVDVDILVTPEGLRRIHSELDGLGFVPPFAGSKNLRDAATTVRIEFLVSGQFPGDGKPKPVAFPDPAGASVEIDGIKFLSLPKLVELKLASGMTGGVNRMKDLVDVVELIKLLKLPRQFGDQLDAYVRAKYAELWEGLQGDVASDPAR